MRKKYFKVMLAVFFLVLCTLGTTGCSSKESEDSGAISKGKRIFEETISPNKDYVENEKDVVYHTVEIYQNSDNVIIVTSKSTSAFFKPLQYEVESDTSITKSDIDVEWTTSMGNPDPTKEDQLHIACVSVSQNGKLLDKRKINFANGAFEIIEDVIESK